MSTIAKHDELISSLLLEDQRLPKRIREVKIRRNDMNLIYRLPAEILARVFSLLRDESLEDM